MRTTRMLFFGTVLILLAVLPSSMHAQDTASTTSLREQVAATERAFAATMAARDLAAFVRFIDDEAIFFSGPEPRRGRQQVMDWWVRYFQEKNAPFSWEPDEVEVLASGTLAHSSGVVRDPTGKPIGRFNSIWRRQPSGEWKIIFDKGSPLPPDNR